MVLKINITLPEETDPQADSVVTEHDVCVSEELSSVSKYNMETIITKMAQVLDAQGISCFRYPKSIYKLYPLSDACREEYISYIQKVAVRFGMTVSCGEEVPGHKKNQEEMNIADNPLYHDTWKLLKKYRDVVWSLELSVQQVRNRFEIEYGSGAIGC